MRPPGVRGLLAADARQRGRRPAARVEHCRPQRFALPAPARRAGDRPDVCRRGVRPPVRGFADHGPQPAERRGGYRRPAGRHRAAGHRRTALRPAGRAVRRLCQSRDRAAYGACGSRPGGVSFGDVARPQQIEIRYRDSRFIRRREVIRGYTAVIFQHEVDHLDGILFIDRMAAERP